MDVSKSVEVFVLVEHLIGALVLLTCIRVHQDNLLLAILVSTFELLVFTALILYRSYQLFLHCGGGWEVACAAIVVLITIFVVLRVALVALVFV